jgi:hypothetical protein
VSQNYRFAVGKELGKPEFWLDSFRAAMNKADELGAAEKVVYHAWPVKHEDDGHEVAQSDLAGEVLKVRRR